MAGGRKPGRPPLAEKSVRHLFGDSQSSQAQQPRSKPSKSSPKSAPSKEKTAQGFDVSENGLVSAVNRYDGAGNGRRLRGWNPPRSGPNVATMGLQKLQDRSRDASRNDWGSSAADRRWGSALIGVGIMPRPKRGLAKEKRARQVEEWIEWCKQADADCVLDFYGLELLSTLEWMVSGEAFIRFRYRDDSFGMKIPLQLQILESDYCPVELDSDYWPQAMVGNRVRQGIEFDKRGRRVAYYFYKEHPTDGVTASVNMSDLVRIPASDVCHLYEPLRAGQIRGVPDAAPVLTYMREMLDYRGSVLERQKLANLLVGFIKQTTGTAMSPTHDPLTGMPLNMNTDGTASIAMEPGALNVLGPNEDMTWSNPPEAGTTYSEYVRTENMALAAGRNLPNEIFSGDLVNISDRTLRIIINEWRRFCEQRQWLILIPQFCQKVRDAWVAVGVAYDVIPLEDAKDWQNCEWATDAWPDIHPFQDIQGRQMEVDAGFRSRQSVIAERGEDAVTVDEERKEDKEREDAFGLGPPDPLQVDPKTGKPDPGQKKPVKSDKPAWKNEIDVVDLVAKLFAGTAALMTANKPEPLAAPVFNVHNNLPAPEVKVEVTNDVEPTEVVVNNLPAPEVKVEVTNDVKPTEVVVNNLPAPEVIVNNTVQPPDVVVELPNRQTETTVERDVYGNIIKSTAVETTIQ
jgi:lambda family phage portal protein